MKNIFNFINNNAIVASLITLAITTTIQIIFRRNDRKYNERIENAKERKKQFENKAELMIDNFMEDDGTIPHIYLIMSDFEVKVVNNKDEVEFYYPKDILDNNKYKHLIFYMKNIGNADINQLDICVTSQKRTMLCNIEEIDVFVKNRLVNYSYCFDRKIMKNKSIMIDIAYLKDSKICNLLGSELALLFRDSYGNLYEQAFFIQRKNLYSPRPISEEEFNLYTLTNTAIECFKNPWMW